MRKVGDYIDSDHPELGRMTEDRASKQLEVAKHIIDRHEAELAALRAQVEAARGIISAFHAHSMTRQIMTDLWRRADTWLAANPAPEETE